MMWHPALHRHLHRCLVRSMVHGRGASRHVHSSRMVLKTAHDPRYGGGSYKSTGYSKDGRRVGGSHGERRSSGDATSDSSSHNSNNSTSNHHGTWSSQQDNQSARGRSSSGTGGDSSGSNSGSSGSRATGSRGGTAKRRERTYYDVLGIPRTARPSQIKERYLQRVKECHPDQNPNDPRAADRFHEVQEAYKVLNDKWKRSQYDAEIQFTMEDVKAAGSAAQGGAGTTQTMRDYWQHKWRMETAEEREARRERYKKYAAGIKDHVPPDDVHPMFPIAYMVLVFLGVSIVGLFAADIHGQNHPDYSDADTDDSMRGVPLVRAYHNPILDKWEALPEGFEPPPPSALVQYFKTEYPHIQIDMGKIPLGGLTILRVPKTQTMPAEFIMDSITGEIGAAPQAVQKKRQRSYLRT